MNKTKFMNFNSKKPSILLKDGNNRDKKEREEKK